ncbi:hypothetical protein KBC54_01040 [Patescibacteria group bacterium]|nr:hypothetical protein [Patescibacteria group bacterium]
MSKLNVAAHRDSLRIVVGLTASVLLFVVVLLLVGPYLFHRQTTLASAVVLDPSSTHQSWRAAVLQAVEQVGPASVDADVQQALDSVLALRVVAADRDMQLQLAVALHARLQHEPGADQKLASLIQEIRQRL